MNVQILLSLYLFEHHVMSVQRKEGMWGEVSMCDTSPTLIILQADLVHHFIYGTNITTDTDNK
jgi:hypothetical protein